MVDARLADAGAAKAATAQGTSIAALAARSYLVVPAKFKSTRTLSYVSTVGEYRQLK